MKDKMKFFENEMKEKERVLVRRDTPPPKPIIESAFS